MGRFASAPVVSERHAIEVATPLLPKEMRVDEEWFEDCFRSNRYAIEVSRVGTSFRVDFQLLDGTESRSVVRQSVFQVTKDGEAVPLSSVDQ